MTYMEVVSTQNKPEFKPELVSYYKECARVLGITYNWFVKHYLYKPSRKRGKLEAV